MCFGVGCSYKVADMAADSTAADKAVVDNTADILAADNNTDFPD